MISLKLCRNTLISFFAVLVIISSTPTLPAYSQESEDSQIFISGFNAYQQKNYTVTIDKMNEVLQKYPDTPLRDMVLFWLSRACYKNGNLQDAAKFMSQFTREYPDNPLKATVDDELLTLTARFEKGEQLPVGSASENPQLLAQKEQAEREKVRLAQARAEQERLAGERAAAEAAALKAREEKSELERLAKLKAEEDLRVQANAAAAKQAAAAEQQNLAALKAEEARRAAEQQRLAVVKEEEERKAVEKAEQIKAESARLATLKAEQERLAQEKAAAARNAEQQKLAAFRAEEERKAAEKLTAEQQLRDDIEHAKLVSQQEELVRLSIEKSEKKRLAAEKAEQERTAAEDAARAAKAEKKRLAALEEEKARAEEARLAALKLEEERKVAEKAERLRAENERLASERAAAVAAEAARLAAVQKEQELKAAEKAEAARLAQEQAVLAKRAALEAEQQRLARQKKEQERAAAELAEKERLATAAADASRLAAAKPAVTPVEALPVAAPPAKVSGISAAAEKNQLDRAALREKAIEQYKSILVTYPNSQAAAAAATKLRELGVAVAQPVQAAVSQPVTTSVADNAQVLRFEVAQFAGLEFNLQPVGTAFNVAQRVSVPFSITNQGNGSDSFYLESGFPAEFASGFSAAAAPAQAINQTTVLAPGESFKGLIHLTIPASSIDGLRISHPVKASSRTAVEATQSREVRLVAAAPLLRATVKADRSNPLPGEKIIYRVVLLNVGSTGAQDVSFRLNFPPQVEPVDFAASGFRQEMKAALVVDGLQLKSGESREFSLAFQLKEGTLAGQEILTRAELNNNQLKTSATFVSTAAYVQPQHGLTITPGSDRLIVIPGQTVSVPFVVTNTGNVREKFSVAPAVKGTQVVTIFHDLNRDGVRQANEPVITEVGPLAAKEEASVVMEIATPRTATDGSDDSAKISFRSSADALRSFEGITRLVYSRPVLQMAMSGKDGRLKPGEVASFDLTITNRGSNLARVVELQSAWPEQLELVAADPATNSFSNGTLLWKFKELGGGEKRVIKVSLRVKPGTGVGTNIQVKNILTYEDQIGNRY